MSTFPGVDESRDRLLCAGWSVGEAAFGARWLVSGSNEENKIQTEGASQAEAWHRACDQAALS